MTMIASNLQAIQARITQASRVAGRQADQVQLLAVSKTFGVVEIEQAIDAGQTKFGENYIQEAIGKMHALRHRTIEWHCIGPIQSNKTRLVAEHFDWVQSIDRLKIAQRLSEQRPAHLPHLQVCIQVNTDGGANKAGVVPGDAAALADAVRLLPRLVLRGLMTIPEPAIDFAASVALHGRARDLFDALNAGGLALDVLSMGMSADLEAAIQAGSTMVRVGTAVFGHR